jgi:uncharacterized protein (TIGR03066 family)
VSDGRAQPDALVTASYERRAGAVVVRRRIAFLQESGDLMRALLGCAAILALCLGVFADEKKDVIDAKTLIGKWSLKGLDKGESVVLEFAKDGKAVLIAEQGGKEERAEGSYTLDGNKLTLTMRIEGKDEKQTLTISKLTNAELIGANEKGKEKTLVRIKDK